MRKLEVFDDGGASGGMEGGPAGGAGARRSSARLASGAAARGAGGAQAQKAFHATAEHAAAGTKRTRAAVPLGNITNTAAAVPPPAQGTRARAGTVAALRANANTAAQARRAAAPVPAAPPPSQPGNLALPFNPHDPLVPSDYIAEIDRHCQGQQQTHAPDRSYMAQQVDINAHMRSILADWLVEVAQEYHFDGETLFLAVNYVDRCLSRMQMQRSRLQLLGVTCMLVASKYEEIYPPPVREFRYITDNTYSREEIVLMEREVLKTLKFELTVPTGKWFLRRYLRSLLLLSGDPELAAAANSPLLNHPASTLPPSPLPQPSPPKNPNQQTTASPSATKHAALNPEGGIDSPGAFAPHVRLTYLSYYLLELTLLDYSFLRYTPSEVAASALLIALYTLHVDAHGENSVSAPMLAMTQGVRVPPPGNGAEPPAPPAGATAAMPARGGTLLAASSFPRHTAMPRHQHQDTPWSPTLQEHTGYAPSDLRACATAVYTAYVEHYRAHVGQAPGSENLPAKRLPAIYEKYREARLACASRIAPPSAIAHYLFAPLSDWPREMQSRWASWARLP